MTLDKAVRDSAIRLLARREHSRRELEQKLSIRGFDKKRIDAALDKLEQTNLLSDARFIGSIVRVRSQRGYGPLKIFAELQRHGISKTRVMQDEDWQRINWCEVAQRAKTKRFGEEIPQTIEEKQQQYRYLIARGFMPEHI